MSTATNSARNPGTPGPATDSSATKTMTNCPPQENRFKPSVFTVKNGLSQHFIRTLDLVQGIDRTSLTADHLSLPNFWGRIKRQFGAQPATHRLLAHVPDGCNVGEKTEEMTNRDIWFAQLLRCSTAGMEIVCFDIVPREKGETDVPEVILEDDDVQIAPSTAVVQRTSRTGQLGCLLVLIVLVVLAGPAGRYAYVSGWSTYLPSFMQGLPGL